MEIERRTGLKELIQLIESMKNQLNNVHLMMASYLEKSISSILIQGFKPKKLISTLKMDYYLLLRTKYLIILTKI